MVYLPKKTNNEFDQEEQSKPLASPYKRRLLNNMIKNEKLIVKGAHTNMIDNILYRLDSSDRRKTYK